MPYENPRKNYRYTQKTRSNEHSGFGSGATMNEIALKLKEKKLAKEIIGLAITGSYKGFEVISEL